MPKIKTHKGLKKRVKVTASGKVKRKKSFAGHLMSSKSGKRKRRLGQPAIMTSANEKRSRILLQA